MSIALESSHPSNIKMKFRVADLANFNLWIQITYDDNNKTIYLVVECNEERKHKQRVL